MSDFVAHLRHRQGHDVRKLHGPVAAEPPVLWSDLSRASSESATAGPPSSGLEATAPRGSPSSSEAASLASTLAGADRFSARFSTRSPRN